jgi:hypothetical protein
VYYEEKNHRHNIIIVKKKKTEVVVKCTIEDQAMAIVITEDPRLSHLITVAEVDEVDEVDAAVVGWELIPWSKQ